MRNITTYKGKWRRMGNNFIHLYSYLQILYARNILSSTWKKKVRQE